MVDDPAVGIEKFGVGHGVEVHGCMLPGRVDQGSRSYARKPLPDYTHFKRHGRGSLQVDDI